MTHYRYKAFGLNILSDFSLPELIPFKGREEVIIIRGTVPESLDNPKSEGVCYQAVPGKFLLRIESVGRFLVTDGQKILVDPNPSAKWEDIRLFLLGSAFGALLHQRGYLPFHGSVIEAAGKAVIFSGVSGSGKSTLAAALKKKGYKILADDIAVISIQPEQFPIVYPSYPQLKLWTDSLLKLGEVPARLRKVRDYVDKFGVPVDTGFHADPLQLELIYVITTHNNEGFEITALQGVEKFKALKNNTYRFGYLTGLELAQQHFNSCALLAQSIQVRRLERGTRTFALDKLVESVEKDIYRILCDD